MNGSANEFQAENSVSGGTRKRRIWRVGLIALALLVCAAALSGPAANGLAYESSPAASAPVDVVYLVAGARDQERRIGILATDWDALRASGAAQPPEVWIGNDSLRAGWSRRAQANLLMAEWAQEKLRARLGDGEKGAETGQRRLPLFRILRGGSDGTDGEMRVLASELARRPDVRRVAVVTSPYHSRRVRERLLHYADPHVRVVSVCGRVAITDRFPWVVAAEWVKIARDRGGLGQCPFLSRSAFAYGFAWVVFFASVLVVVYGWIAYPWILSAAARRRGKRGGAALTEAPPQSAAHAAGQAQRAQSGEGGLPEVAVILSAYREERVIGARIANLLAVDYPRDRIQVWVGVDGVEDRTAEVARMAAQGSSGVNIVEFPVRRGKAAVLKDLVWMSGCGRREAGGGMRSTAGAPSASSGHVCCGYKAEGKSGATVAPAVSAGSGNIEREALTEAPQQSAVHAAGQAQRTQREASGAGCGMPGRREGVREYGTVGVRGAEAVGQRTEDRWESTAGEADGCSSRRVGGTDASRPDILVFTDANTRFKPDALRRLAAPFRDPTVGGVCGRLVFESREEAPTQENVYWEREARWKRLEGEVDSCLGANGAIYAIRSSLFWRDLPTNTIVDDFVIGMKIREQGYRMAFEPAATAVEELPAEVRDEWRRRIRIGAGAYQALGMCRRCLLPRYGWFAWMFWSHKAVRWFTPHLLLLAGAAAVAIPLYAADVSPWDRAPVAVGLALAAAATTGRLLGGLRRGGVVSVLKSVDYFFTIEAAMFVGFLRFCRGNLKGMWERTARG